MANAAEGLAVALAPTGFETLLGIDQSVLDAIPAAIYICSTDGTIARFNRRAVELWGRAPEAGGLGARFGGAFRLYDGDGQPLPLAEGPMATALRSGVAQRDIETIIERPDGSRVVALVNIEPIRDAAGSVGGAISCFQDITDRKHAEAALARRIEEQAALYGFTDQLNRAASPAEVLAAALDAILRALRCSRASILMLDQTKVMRFVAWRGLSESYRRAVEGYSPWKRDAIHPQPVCLTDIEEVPQALKATVKAEGIAALAFVPIEATGKLIGEFMAYFDAPRPFAEAEIGLAVTIARQLGFALQRLRAEETLRAREAELETIINRTPFMLTRCSRDLRYRFVSRAYAEMLGRPAEGLVGKAIVDVVGEEGFQTFLPHIERVLQGQPVEYEMEVDFRGVGRRFMHVVYTPERDEHGAVAGWIASLLDVTERRRAEQALRDREAELELIINRTPFMLIRCSPDLRYRFVSQAYAEMLGRRAEDIVDKPMREVIGEDAFKTVLPHINKVLQGERAVYDDEVLYQGVGKRYLHGVYTPDKDEHGRVNGWIASIVDITERKRAESQRDLLVAELSHRVKNTLATVISIAQQSFARARSADEARRSFGDRIRALAQTHTRLAEANWSGVPLETLIRDEMAPYRDGGSEVHLLGPQVTLTPKRALSLGMAIHELATNAAKHGALSTKGGVIEVTWQLGSGGRKLHLDWQETGGRPVALPRHSGFGRLLLERTLAADLQGTVQLDFQPDGLKCLIEFPLSAPPAIAAEDRAPTAMSAHLLDPEPREGVDEPGSSAAERFLSGTRVLIVEDEALVALELEELLNPAGAIMLGPFGDLARAMETARRETIDLALLDTNLNGEMVYPLADDLASRGVPFIFVTGYGTSSLPSRFRSAPQISKPFEPRALIEELKKTIDKGLSRPHPAVLAADQEIIP